MTTLSDALAVASSHWLGRSGGKVMVSMCSACVEVLGPSTGLATLRAPQAVKLLAALRDRGLSAKSALAYYGAFKRMVALNDGPSTAPWPKAPTPPRRTRDRLSDEDLLRIDDWLRTRGYTSTADLGKLLRGTGMRVRIEALHPEGWSVQSGVDYDTLHIVGKGGHERDIPVVDPYVRKLLVCPKRLQGMARWTYETHLDRWNDAVAALSITSRLATFHAVRHGYASDALERTKSIAVVQQLLGHADPGTTARYLHVDLADTAKALAS